MKEATWSEILLAGGGGGLAYWAYTLFRGGQPAAEVAQFRPEVWLWVSLVLVVILGSAAAFLMVYFVAATNTKERMRAVGFAAACGLCWEPVLAGVTDRFTRTYADREATAKVAAAQELREPGAEQAGNVAADLLQTTPAVQNPILKAQVREQTERLVQTIEATPDPVVRTEALQAVGEAAAQAREPAVLARTVKSLETIADTQQQHEQRARRALKAIDAKVAASSP